MGDTYGGPVTGDPEGKRASYQNTKLYLKGVPSKSLCLIPQRFQIAMVDDGWICRNTIIWYKPNCMPSSAKDRFTVDFEYLFFFSKSQRYYFETQYEPILSTEKVGWQKTGGQYYPNIYKNKDLNNRNFSNPNYEWKNHALGRIKRCVWKIATQPFSEAHFATFPPALVKTPLLATCPIDGIDAA